TKWTTQQKEAVATFIRDFTVSKEKLEALAETFVEHLNQGLTGPAGDLAMFPTFVSGRSDGHERGSYLALDLGGTNLYF
ncbi:hexokinase A, partial [Podila epigama]